MSPAVETGVLIAASIVVGVTLILIPTPRHKPSEFDTPPPVTTPEQADPDTRLEHIEARLLHMQQQVQGIEQKVK